MVVTAVLRERKKKRERKRERERERERKKKVLHRIITKPKHQRTPVMDK